MSEAPRGRLQAVVQHSLLACLIAGLGVFPAAWLVSRTAISADALRAWGDNPASSPEPTSGPRVAESQRLIDAGEPRAALVMLQTQLEAYPGNAYLWSNACVAHGLLRERREAVAACSRAVALRPQERLFVNNLNWVRSLPQP